MNEVYLFRVASDEPIRLWSGNGDLWAPPCLFEPDGAIYSGMGELAELPPLQALINGIAQRVAFTVSGVSPQIIATALDDRDSIKEREARIGSLIMDADLQTVGIVNLEWKGVCDVLTWDISSTEQGVSRSLSLSVRSGDTARSRGRPSFFTDADQRRKSPTDAFFDHVAGISIGTTRRFGPS